MLSPDPMCSCPGSIAAVAVGGGSLESVQSTNGNPKVVYCVFEISRGKCVPIGTAFAISTEFAVTARHVVYKTNGKASKISLFQSSLTTFNMVASTLIEMEVFASNKYEDWVVMKRKSGRFTDGYAEICKDDEVPKYDPFIMGKRPKISVHYFPCGKVTTGGATVLTLERFSCKIVSLAPLHKPSTGFSGYTIVSTPPAHSLPDAVITVEIANFSGASGAPYFGDHGKIVAFHSSSLSDTTGNHLGYVLCRLPKFTNWSSQNLISATHSMTSLSSGASSSASTESINRNTKRTRIA